MNLYGKAAQDGCSLALRTSPAWPVPAYSQDYPIPLIIGLNQELPRCLPPAPASGSPGNWWAPTYCQSPLPLYMVASFSPRVMKMPAMSYLPYTVGCCSRTFCFRCVRFHIVDVSVTVYGLFLWSCSWAITRLAGLLGTTQRILELELG